MQAWLALLLLLLPLQSSRPTSRPAEKTDGPAPARLDDLQAPSRSRKDETLEFAPQDGRIARNSGVAGRFLEEGTDVEYAFESKAGEVSLFQLSTWGFARGWQSTAEIRILDEAGFELASRMRHGGTRYQVFLAFEAPRDGTFRCQLRAAKEYYRYTLARHSDFPASHGKHVTLGQGTHSYGYLADSSSRVIFELDLEANRPVSLNVVNADERTRRMAANRREKNLFGARETASMGMKPMEERGPDQDWPSVALRVRGLTEPPERAPHYLCFTPKVTGTYAVEVFSESNGDGGIFALEIDRNLDEHYVRGHIADKQARLEDGVELRFFLEPDLGLATVATTDERGNYATSLPHGSYTVTLVRPGAGATSLRTNVFADRELNAIYSAPPAKAPTSRPTRD